MLRVRAHFDFEREFSRRRFRLTLFEAKRTVPAASHQPEGRELLVEWCTGCNTQDVSILSQPEGRELRTKAWDENIALTFQSSPSPKAGSYSGDRQELSCVMRFNPLPARRPGATLICGVMALVVLVSILSQPEGRELRPRQPKQQRSRRFQSSPSPKAGSYVDATDEQFAALGFNPLPARRPGATPVSARRCRRGGVSILSQPEGRELRQQQLLATYLVCFNPLPARRPGATPSFTNPR